MTMKLTVARMQTRLSPYGESGLKFLLCDSGMLGRLSLSVWREWVEILSSGVLCE